MQEEVDSRMVALSISAAKFTGQLFKAAIGKYMAHRREKKLADPVSSVGSAGKYRGFSSDQKDGAAD